MRTIVILTTVEIENGPTVDSFKDWFRVMASVVGLCCFPSPVVLYEVLGLTVVVVALQPDTKSHRSAEHLHFIKQSSP
eukprot:GAHX01005761.1.p2 GENE.GAHX01005761.1~~GAHX01005761.1.p2  ORF type:complete len:78 (-),score=2.77 GAHX01005761.1:68-301(-)